MGRFAGRLALVLVVALAWPLVPVTLTGEPSDGMVREGHARFHVLTSTLIRLEYADDDHFEDRPTFNAVSRDMPAPSFTTRVVNGYLEIKTDRLTLRYRNDSGPFTSNNLNVDLLAGPRAVTAKPDWNKNSATCLNSDHCDLEVAPAQPANLGGWRRSLDTQEGSAPLADGLLSRDGWYLLEDTDTALMDGHGGTTPRPNHGAAAYQDGYFFGYGHDYKQGLQDLRALTGPAVLLPRWAFGVWYSRYFPYSDADWRNEVVPAFRAHQTPLDVIVVDTEFKSPNDWDGWEWNPQYFPDPVGFFRWAKQQGLQTMVNIHPSISAKDPRLAEAERVAGKSLPKGDCIFVDDCRVFDWGDPAQLAAYFALQKQFTDQGADILWPDWCCDGSYSSVVGVTPDTWINSRYVAEADARGRRGFSLQRMGSDLKEYIGSPTFSTGPWAEHRYTVHFTADAAPTWDMLSFEAAVTAKDGAVGEPYVTHDIGGHMDIPGLPSPGHLSDDMYARWVQFGAFQPMLRLHSDHGDRLPWNYGPDAERSAEEFLRLREALVPYTYTLARQAHDTGVPIVRSLYLDYPEYDEAYAFDRQYLYGSDVLVAPIAQPNNDAGVASATVWFPPGTWTDYFTGRTYTGPSVQTVDAGWDTMPVFLRQGGILTTNTDAVDHDGQQPLTSVTVDVAAGGHGSFQLYEDAGEGHDYQRGQQATTQISYTETAGGHERGTLTISPQRGSFTGQVKGRAWTLRLHSVTSPNTVRINEQSVPHNNASQSWSYDELTHTLTVHTAARSTMSNTVITYS